MKFGIHNPSWLFGPDPAEIFEAVKAKALWAESRGFTWFSVMDHLIQIANVGAPDEPFMEGWTVLSALAAVTSRIRLATLATSVAFRNPAHLAKIAAGVDLISRGRLTFGFGAGWHEPEYRQYRLGISAKACRAHPADGGSRAADPRTMDGTAHDVPRPVFPRRGRDPGTQADTEAAPADHDRRRGRAAHVARRRPARRCVQCRGQTRDGEATCRSTSARRPRPDDSGDEYRYEQGAPGDRRRDRGALFGRRRRRHLLPNARRLPAPARARPMDRTCSRVIGGGFIGKRDREPPSRIDAGVKVTMVFPEPVIDFPAASRAALERVRDRVLPREGRRGPDR